MQPQAWSVDDALAARQAFSCMHILCCFSLLVHCGCSCLFIFADAALTAQHDTAQKSLIDVSEQLKQLQETHAGAEEAEAARQRKLKLLQVLTLRFDLKRFGTLLASMCWRYC